MESFIAHPPDGFFYLILTLLLVGILGKIIVKFTDRVEKTLERLEDTCARLTTLTEVQQVQIASHDKRLNDIEEKDRLVKYKR